MVHIQKEVSIYEDTTHSVEVKQMAEIFLNLAQRPSGIFTGVRGPLVQGLPWIEEHHAHGSTLVLVVPYRTFDKWPVSVA